MGRNKYHLKKDNGHYIRYCSACIYIHICTQFAGKPTCHLSAAHIDADSFFFFSGAYSSPQCYGQTIMCGDRASEEGVLGDATPHQPKQLVEGLRRHSDEAVERNIHKFLQEPSTVIRITMAECKKKKKKESLLSEVLQVMRAKRREQTAGMSGNFARAQTRPHPKPPFFRPGCSCLG